MQRKTFDKIQHTFMIKTLQKMGIEGTYLNIVKAIYDKPTVLNWTELNSKHYSQWRKNESIPPKIRNKTSGIRVSTFTAIIQHSFRSPSYSREEKEIKGIQIRKEVKLSLLADYMILYIENPNDSIRKLLELISEFSSFRIQNQYTEITCISIY